MDAKHPQRRFKARAKNWKLKRIKPTEQEKPEMVTIPDMLPTDHLEGDVARLHYKVDQLLEKESSQPVSAELALEKEAVEENLPEPVDQVKEVEEDSEVDRVVAKAEKVQKDTIMQGLKEDVEVRRRQKRTDIIVSYSILALAIIVILLEMIFKQTRANMASSPKNGSTPASSKVTTSSTKVPELVTVPDVRDKTEDEARKILEKTGFKVGQVVQEESDTVAEGKVIGLDHAIGFPREKGSSLTLYIAKKKMVTVPPLAGDEEIEAQRELEELGFTVEKKKEWDDQTEAGYVIRTDPSANTSLTKGSKVILVISKGREKKEEKNSESSVGPVYVPDVSGWNSQAAETELQRRGFRVNKEEEYSDDYTKGMVMGTNPGSNTPLAKGATVTLYVSKGSNSVTIPSVVGQTATAARQVLENAGLVVVIEEQTSDTVAKGYVVDSFPSSNITATRGDTVTLYVSSGSSSPKE